MLKMYLLRDAILEEVDASVGDGRLASASVITSKPAIRYHFKTGQRDWPKT